MQESVHPTAVIDPAAWLGRDVKIGPYCVIGPEVVLGDGVTLMSHVTLGGRTEIGARTTIYPFASLGHPPQDLKYDGEPSRLVIGEDTVIREYVTMNPGTHGGGMVTRVGAGGLFMVGAHVAHDCQIGDQVILANNATLGGHVQVGDHAIIGGLSAVHQFVRIGDHAMIGGMSGVENDVIPFGLVNGERARLNGLNLVGLERRGFEREAINRLRHAYRLLFSSDGTFSERLEDVSDSLGGDALVERMLAFIRSEAARPLCRPR